MRRVLDAYPARGRQPSECQDRPSPNGQTRRRSETSRTRRAAAPAAAALPWLAPRAAEDAQQRDEEVDEVEVEAKGAEDRELLRALGVREALLAHHLQALQVVGRE